MVGRAEEADDGSVHRSCDVSWARVIADRNARAGGDGLQRAKAHACGWAID